MLGGFLLLSGLTCGAPMALLPMIQAESLGLRRYGSLNGILSIAFTLGLATGPAGSGQGVRCNAQLFERNRFVRGPRVGRGRPCGELPAAQRRRTNY
jgi:hypothetical protein